MIRRPSGRLRGDPVKSQRRQIEFIDKDVDHLNGIVLVNPVSKALWKQRCLTTICTFNEALHPVPRTAPAKSLRENHMKQRVFTQPGSFAADWHDQRHVRFARERDRDRKPFP